jgi:hypothetical protein
MSAEDAENAESSSGAIRWSRYSRIAARRLACAARKLHGSTNNIVASLQVGKGIYPRGTRKTRSLHLARFAGPATRELRRGGLPALLANFTAARTISWLLLRSGKANLSAEDAETRSLHLARVACPVSASEIHPRRTQKPPSLHLDMTSLGAGCLPTQSAALSLANVTPATMASALSHVGEGCSMSAANGALTIVIRRSFLHGGRRPLLMSARRLHARYAPTYRGVSSVGASEVVSAEDARPCPWFQSLSNPRGSTGT